MSEALHHRPLQVCGVQSPLISQPTLLCLCAQVNGRLSALQFYASVKGTGLSVQHLLYHFELFELYTVMFFVLFTNFP
uniref:Uncharacterized protein n=1 Tax=Anguilla anguilla TaxID=7936 RepID=A0A0E9WMI0_ANGAN